MPTDGSYGDPGTRRGILDAAWRLLEERGADLTMQDVANDAGVSRQAVYLHLGDRSGLLVALVGHIDDQLGLAERARSVREAATGRQALEALVALHADYTGEIIGVVRALHAARRADPAVAAAWEDRMARRRASHREVVRRIAEDGELATGWDIPTAAMLVYATTLPRLWEELVSERGWSPEQYRRHLTRLLVGALVDTG